MIDGIVKQWDARKDMLRESFATKRPDSYEDICDRLVRVVLTDPVGDKYPRNHAIDPDAVTVIDHGDYQGTQIFVLCLRRYQPDEDSYLWFDNGYGSCSGCDSLEALIPWDRKTPIDDEELDGYMSLALHMVQRMKWLNPPGPPRIEKAAPPTRTRSPGPPSARPTTPWVA